MEYLERKVKHCLIYYYITTSLIQSHKKLAKTLLNLFKIKYSLNFASRLSNFIKGLLHGYSQKRGG